MSVAAKWQQFFLEAGIPRKIAVQYSHLFVEQRISETMLEEIDKSTLVDLGITTIGDQIAILRHIRAKALNRGDSKSSQRMIDTDGKRKESNMPTPDVESSKPTRTRLAPDRDDIYHVRLPAGTTPRTRAIMAKHNLMKSAGLLKRGFTGVRQAGREVQAVSNRNYVSDEELERKSSLKKTMVASPEVSSTTSNVYERLGVQGLVSDAMRQAVPIRSLSTSTPSRNQHFTKATSLVHRALDEAIAPRANQPLFRVRISDEQGPRTSRFHRGAISRIAGGQIRRDLRTLKMAPGGSVRKRSVVATRPSTAVYTQFRGKRIGIKPQVSVFERLG
uniref:SAM domain-containing protein n=1 Tax=Parascaris univalens TaxID=6257 RepID=A0A915AD15_PARUN